MSRILYSGTKNASNWAFRAWLALKEASIEFEAAVRDTYVTCNAGSMNAYGSCDTRYVLDTTLGTRCHGQNYRMRYESGEWTVVTRIALDQSVDVQTGDLVIQKPSAFGCRGLRLSEFSPL